MAGSAGFLGWEITTSIEGERLSSRYSDVRITWSTAVATSDLDTFVVGNDEIEKLGKLPHHVPPFWSVYCGPPRIDELDKNSKLQRLHSSHRG